ncbi:MAG: Lrp/AsnC ligand binding domain-containing protein, partial [Betaproteobacteria bacterium]
EEHEGEGGFCIFWTFDCYDVGHGFPDAEFVQKKLIELPQVIYADFVFGPCDFIVPVRAKNQIDLQKAIQAVHNSVTGLEEAYTTVVAMIQI